MKETNKITVAECPLGGKHCASCMYYRGWWNTRCLHEGDPTFCDHHSFSDSEREERR